MMTPDKSEMTYGKCSGPSGLNSFSGAENPDLTVEAIEWRRFAPH